MLFQDTAEAAAMGAVAAADTEAVTEVSNIASHSFEMLENLPSQTILQMI